MSNFSNSRIVDQTFRDECKTNPLYRHIDVDAEYWNFMQWIGRADNMKKKVRATRARFKAWLGRIPSPPTEEEMVRAQERLEREERLAIFAENGEVCPRCMSTGTEIVPGKGARPCDHVTKEYGV